MTATQDDQTGQPAPPSERYAWYMLGILVLVYMLNFIDRQILSILAEDIKRDLRLTDADLGFLYGTAFGVFYSLFGIPLGRLADKWHRIRLMTAGLALWSTMTALSGFARNGVQLAAARIGVGIGEATASPSAYSLISDSFPREKRATALAIYSAGLYLGGGLSLFIGGLIVKNWNLAYPQGGPLGLVGWQAAFLAVGLPGLLVAIWVSTLREPVRGLIEGTVTPPAERPFRDFLAELATIVPPLTLAYAASRGARAFAINAAAVILIGAISWQLAVLTTSWQQWSAIGLGVYAVFSWATALRARDLPTFRLIVGTPAFVLTVVAYGLNAFIAYAMSFWAAPYAMRVLGAPADQAGFLIGGSGALGGFLGVVIGGRVADRLRRTNPAGRMAVVIFSAVAPVPLMVLGFTAGSLPIFYAIILPAQALASAALGAAAATTQDLVLPRMRGTATATFFIGTTLLGLGLGPYLAGHVSTLTGNLATGMLSLIATVPVGLAAAIAAYRLLPAAEASRTERARAAGEAI